MSGQGLITLGEGNTPLLRIEGIYFKCEFENPTGSQKDRGFAYQISKLKEKGIKKAVLSSSGNAAISAARYCKLANIALTIFVSPDINKNKLKVLENLDCRIIKSHKAVSDAAKYVGENNAYNLRQSKDQNATIGYESIAPEIIKEIIPDGVFIPVSSGTTLVGISNWLGKSNFPIPMHAVQTDSVHPIAGIFDKDFSQNTQKSLADAIVAKYTPREEEVVSIIRKTHGFGWVTSNIQMEEARKWLLGHNLNCSYEGAATLSALWKAKKKGYEFQNPVCLLTGKYYDK